MVFSWGRAYMCYLLSLASLPFPLLNIINQYGSVKALAFPFLVIFHYCPFVGVVSARYLVTTKMTRRILHFEREATLGIETRYGVLI